MAGALRPMRTALRLARGGLHLAYGAVTIAVVYPFAGMRVRLALKRRWSRQLLSMLGVSLRYSPAHSANGGLLVANHISWLDIYVINAMAPAAFVCKADVRQWPLIGWLCAHTDTIFIKRGRRNSASRVAASIRAQLDAGRRVAVFPEGTSSDGSRVLPFHGALLQAAIDAGARIQPVALAYVGSGGQRSTAAAYCGDTSLWESLIAIARADDLTAEAHFLPSLSVAGQERRTLALLLQRLIATRSVRPAADSAVGTRDDVRDALPSMPLPTGNPNPAAGSLPFSSLAG